MERLSFEVPGLYADHQVPLVKEKVESLPGVGQVQVSATFGLVIIEVDAEQTRTSLVKEALEGLDLQGEGEMVTPPPADKGDPAWFRVGSRNTQTNPQEITMSGEFRKY